MAITEFLRVGMIIPTSGPAGLFGPSCRNCADLAVLEINMQGGIGRRLLKLVYVDAGPKPSEVAAVIRTLIDNDVIEAMIGMHDSDVRRAVIDANKTRVPYFYVSPYEGGENTSGVFVLGETPQQQLKPVIPWLMENRGAKHWYLIGNDYSWPRQLHGMAKKYIEDSSGDVVAQHFVPFQETDFSSYINDIQERKPDCVMVSLVGESSIAFNRVFDDEALAKEVLRFGPLMEENTLMALGPDRGQNLLTAAGYFTDVKEPENVDFQARYLEQYGPNAPVITSLSQSCYEGLLLLREIAAKAASIDVAALTNVAEGLCYRSPRGSTEIRNNHAVRNIHLAESDGPGFNIVTTFNDVVPS